MKISQFAKDAASKLPPNILQHPMPFPDAMEIAEERIQQAINDAIADLESRFSAGPWRLTSDSGSKLLYCGDTYAGKLSPPMHFEVLRKLNEYEELQNTRVALEAKIRSLQRTIDELNQAAIDSGDIP